VPELLVDNQDDRRVLFLDGEELIGAKQNRVLNASVLVAAHSKVKLPVSCVEEGRWRMQSKYFRSSGSHTPSKLRRAMMASVSKSVKEAKGHFSDQSEVWEEVAHLHAAHGVESTTDAMSDAFQYHAASIDAYRANLKYVPGACGVAVAVEDRVVCLDLFDKPATCQKVWDRMLSGVVFDALEAGPSTKQASVEDVQQLIDVTGVLTWEPSDAVGEGDEYRAESDRGDHATALALQQTVVHGCLLAGR
jgi:hypothetical protein